MKNDEEFARHLMETFKTEAQEHIREMSLLLINLEKDEAQTNGAELLEAIFREAHSLKGASRAVSLKDFEMLCHALESVFSQLKKKELTLSTALFDLVHDGLDYLEKRLLSIEESQTDAVKAVCEDLIQQLDSFQTETDKQPSVQDINEAEPISAAHPKKEAETDTGITKASLPEPLYNAETGMEKLKVSASRLSNVLLQSEEMLSVKLSAAQRLDDMRNVRASMLLWDKEWGAVANTVQHIRNRIIHDESQEAFSLTSSELRGLVKLLDFIEWNNEDHKRIKDECNGISKLLKQDRFVLDTMVNTLLADMKKITMLPFSSLLEMFPKIVRDLCKDSGREADLEIVGGELEIDRRILDEMRDPLIHLIRNCIDHGIENPHERLSKNKIRRGRITIEIIPRDHKVEVILSDDGRGLSAEKIKAAMLKSGTLSVTQGDALSDQDLTDYVFYSGVSTSPIITDLSGRGLGLAIVKEKVDKLGGCITLESKPDVGTSFHILLPLTVAIFRGILVSAGGQEFILPTMYVERVLHIAKEDVKRVGNRETIMFNDHPLSMTRMSTVLGMKENTDQLEPMMHIVILAASHVRIAFAVDRIINEKEVLFKNLGPQLSRVRNIAGATVLGSGNVVPIINVPDLLKSAAQPTVLPPQMGIALLDEPVESENRRVLVVEDSITTRAFLKNILETAGYIVNTATDGVDALEKLKTAGFDAVVTDVEMPKMSGFELTKHIREDRLINDMPVILVTALATREDREQGMEVGANAYILKKQFDQSNLLDILKKLIHSRSSL